MKQQFFGSEGLVGVEATTGTVILGDMGVEEPHLAIALLRVGLRYIDPPVADRLDLRSSQHQSRFKSFQDFVIPPGAAILRNSACRFSRMDSHEIPASSELLPS